MLGHGPDIPGADIQRLGQMGLIYRYPDGRTYERPTDAELVARQKLVDILDAELGPSAPMTPLEFAKGAIISETIGDNRNASRFDKIFGRWKSESAEQLVASGRAHEEIIRQIRRRAEFLRDLPKSRT